MSARLADLGFAVTAMDVVPENFRLHDSVPFIAANLNDALPVWTRAWCWTRGLVAR
jgi:hypothetical protein